MLIHIIMDVWKLSYCNSCTPEIKPVIKAVCKNCLRSPQICWLSEAIRLRALDEGFSKVNKPDVLIILSSDSDTKLWSLSRVDDQPVS
jgi:5'-3' exonuclease